MCHDRHLQKLQFGQHAPRPRALRDKRHEADREAVDSARDHPHCARGARLRFVAATTGPAAPPWFGDFFYSSGPGSGWTLFVLLVPAFIISPGLIQKSWGASSERALRTGIALNAVVLLLFAFLPVLMGMVARVAMPGIEDPNAVLPTVLRQQLPAWLGALALAAVFSTEVDTCDAILFMLATSLSKDLYKRFVHPDADDRRVLLVARLAAVVGGLLGIFLATRLATVVDGLTIFYSLLAVSLFVPVIGGLFTRRPGAPEALASIAAGVVTLLVVRAATAGQGYGLLNPNLLGLAAAGVAYFGLDAVRGRRPTPAR
jgi:SSS family solute:Na+ symporter